MVFIRLIPALFGLLLAVAVAQDGNARTGLWVTLESGGHFYRLAVTDKDGQSYVRDFVAGLAPGAIPRPFLKDWLATAGLNIKTVAADHARITSAEECPGDGGACSILRGLYAGRSPNS